MSVYADTSLLISYYINDSNSVRAQGVIHAMIAPLPFTGLHRLEMRNALALCVFRRVLTAAQAAVAWSDVERDLRSGRLGPHPVNWTPIYRSAVRYSCSDQPVSDSCHSQLKRLNHAPFVICLDPYTGLAVTIIIA